MAGGYVGTSGGNKEITGIRVGTVAGMKTVTQGWVGTSSGNKQWFRTYGTPVLSASATAYDTVALSWTNLDPAVFTYKVYRQPSTLLATTAATSWTDTGRSGSTAYSYRVEAIRNGAVASTAYASVTTPAAPPPAPTYRDETRVWSGYPVEIASYSGSGARRTNWVGTNNGQPAATYGYYSGTWGSQQSQARWAIPGEIRNCLSVSRVELRWWNIHHYLSTGGRVSMVGHHNTSLNTYGGNTGPLLNSGTQVAWPAPRGSWINGSEWYDLAWLTSSGRPSIAEEIRVLGLQGFGLVPAVGGQSGYGYAGMDPILRITYVVRVQV